MLFLRHFRTKIDKTKPVSEWELDDDGKKAMGEFLEENDFSGVKRIITSPENKALLTAKEISERFGKEIKIEPLIAEVDRSNAGFIEGDYKSVVKQYFESDDFEYEWEPLDQVKDRIRVAIRNLEPESLVISHGMFLSLMLAPCLGKDTIEFWQELEFGQLLDIPDESLDYWRK